VAREFEARTGGTVERRGTVLCWEGPCTIAPDRSILSAEDKSACVKGALSRRCGVRKALVIGDTEDDRALRDGAASVLGDRNVFLIALKPKDHTIRDAANAVYRSWRELEKAIRQTQLH